MPIRVWDDCPHLGRNRPAPETLRKGEEVTKVEYMCPVCHKRFKKLARMWIHAWSRHGLKR